MTDYLGKDKPKEHGSNWRQQQCQDCVSRMNYWIEMSDYHRNALKEATDILESLLPHYKGMPDLPKSKWTRMCTLVKHMRKSVGDKE